MRNLTMVLWLSFGLMLAAPADSLRLEALARRTYEAIWTFRPVAATRAGVHKGEARLSSYTPARVAAYVRKLKALLTELEGIDTARLSLDGRIDWLLLRANLGGELFWFVRQPQWQKNPVLYADECLGGVYYLVLYDYAPLKRRAAAVAGRMAEVPWLLAEARRNVKFPPRLFAEAAIEMLQAGTDFFQKTATALAESCPALRRNLLGSAQRAVRAMDDYRRELEAVLPSLPDSFAMGRTDYEFLLQKVKFLDFGVDSLVALGERMYAWSDSLSRELRAQKARAESLNPQAEKGEEPAPEGFSKQELLAYYRAEVDSMRAWVANSGFATVPDYVGKLGVMETPAFLLGVIPGLAMEPAMALDSNQDATILIATIPEEFDSAQREYYYRRMRNRRFRGAVVHEGFPGHHFQICRANHHPSLIRRLQGDDCFIEGWALYCEQAVVEHGLYPPDPFPQLGWLGGVKFRSARVILDAKLHTGEMSYDQAVNFLLERFGADTASYRAEVKRYCLTPTQPLSYVVGKAQIMELRQEYLQRGHTLREFHDRLLSEGSIPLSLVRRKLLAEQ